MANVAPAGITVIGNLTADPVLRATAGNVPVTNFTVASTPRVYDRELGEYKDGETTFFKFAAWRAEAENVAASLHKGSRVVVIGTDPKLNEWTTPAQSDGTGGEKRQEIVWDVAEVGASLKFHTATLAKASAAVAAAPAAEPVAPPAAAPQATAAAAAAPLPVTVPAAVAGSDTF